MAPMLEAGIAANAFLDSLLNVAQSGTLHPTGFGDLLCGCLSDPDACSPRGEDANRIAASSPAAAGKRQPSAYSTPVSPQGQAGAVLPLPVSLDLSAISISAANDQSSEADPDPRPMHTGSMPAVPRDVTQSESPGSPRVTPELAFAARLIAVEPAETRDAAAPPVPVRGNVPEAQPASTPVVAAMAIGGTSLPGGARPSEPAVGAPAPRSQTSGDSGAMPLAKARVPVRVAAPSGSGDRQNTDADPSPGTETPSPGRAHTADATAPVPSCKGGTCAHSDAHQDSEAEPASPQTGNPATVPILAGHESPSPAAPEPHIEASAPAARIEPQQPTPLAPVSHDVALRLEDGRGNVDIRMTERGGEIRVTVHTTDGELAGSLRADLPDLVSKLRQNGFLAEAWHPAGAAASSSGKRGDAGNHGDAQQESRREGREQQNPQKHRNPARWAGEWESRREPAQEVQI